MRNLLRIQNKSANLNESVIFLAIALLGNISFEFVVLKNGVHCLSIWLSLPMFANSKPFWNLAYKSVIAKLDKRKLLKV